MVNNLILKEKYIERHFVVAGDWGDFYASLGKRFLRRNLVLPELTRPGQPKKVTPPVKAGR